MRQRRSRALLAGALTLPAVAASLALGPGMAQANVRTPASTVTWHKLTPINGWASGQTGFHTGGPSWTISNGIVYLSGSVFRSSGTKTQFATLPPQARPSHAIWLSVYTESDSVGNLVIKPGGSISAFGAQAPGFTSLATVSFPARSTAQTPITLQHGWFSEQGAFNSGDPAFTVRDGIVYLSGSMATTSGRSIFAVLPKAARPQSVEYITVYTFGGTFGTLQINPNGTARAYAGSATQYTSLAGVSFPAAVIGEKKLTLINGWHSEQGVFNSGDPAFTVRNGIVYLSGSMATSSINTQFAVLPPAARPSHLLYIKTYAFGSSSGTIFITASGDIEAYSPESADAQNYTSLASISYPLKS